MNALMTTYTLNYRATHSTIKLSLTHYFTEQVMLIS